MKVCPKCGSLVSDDGEKCSSCGTDLSGEMVYDKVESSGDTLDIKKRKRTKIYFLRFLLVLALSGGVAAANYFGQYRWYAVILAVYGFFTLLAPEIYLRMCAWLFIRDWKECRPTDLYFAFHILLGLASFALAIILPLWQY